MEFRGKKLTESEAIDLLLKESKKTRAQIRGEFGKKGVKSISEADGSAVRTQPNDLTVGEAYCNYGKQLEFPWWDNMKEKKL